VGQAKVIRNKGATFCHVANRKQFVHEIEDMTDGNQWWNGTAPILINKLISNKVEGIKKGRLVSWIRMEERRNRFDPRAWTRKYFTEASSS
jgi:hypothetical protein